MLYFCNLIIALRGVSILNQASDDQFAEGFQQLIHSRHLSVDALRLGDDLTGERSFQGANLVTNGLTRGLTAYVLGVGRRRKMSR